MAGVVMTRRAKALAEAWAQRRPDHQTPVYFVGQDLNAPRATLVRGRQWDPQDKRAIRLWGPAFGVHDADARAWHELPYVLVVVAPLPELANEIVQRGLEYDDAVAFVNAWLEEHPAP